MNEEQVRDVSAERDDRMMRRALELAERGLGLAAPNPMVGAVVVAGDEVVGEGWHEGPGTDHAEIVAMREAGPRAAGATLYVTLEPCSHQGRTGPCAPAVVAAGIGRVVAALQDPYHEVDGRGLRILREAGLEVDVGTLAEAAGELVAGFARQVTTGLPLVTLKVAASLDGRVAARDGTSRWITGPEARADVHRLRARAGAVMVGSGTALADDPALTVRLPGYRGRQPLRVLMDGRGRTPPRAALFDGAAPTLVATTAAAAEPVRRAWEAEGAEVLVAGARRVSVGEVVAHLGKEREVQEVLIEGGPTLAAAAVQEGVVDRLAVYLAPMLIGGRAAPGMLGGEGVATIAGAVPLRIRSVERLGEDVKVVADVHRDH